MDLLVLSNPFVSSSLVIFLYVTLGFIVSIIIKRNDIADVMWGPGIALAAHTAVWSSEAELSLLLSVLLSLVTIWATRLGLRIGKKNFRKPDEDPRYKRWREAWHFFYIRSYFQVFLLQGFLMLVLAYPVIHAVSFNLTIQTPIIIVGVLLWLVGLYFEAVGDRQLDRFINDPQNRGQLMKQGLWRYTRHPNYFGEITMWWAIGLMTISLPFGYVALISPITITLLIRYVSGVPLLEAQMQKHPDWAKYAAKTSMLIPLPPRKG